jgi:hypothetical protein
MIIEVKTEKCVYITIGDYTYYVDDSTGEQIIDKWDNTKTIKEED